MSCPHSTIKGIIFDLDGTIISSLDAYTGAFNRGLKAFGLDPVTAASIANLLDQGFRLGQVLIRLFPSVFENENKRRTCEDSIRKAYIELEPNMVSLKPGVYQTLQSLKATEFKIGIVTGRTTKGEHKWRELHRLNISQFIDIMVTGFEAPAKPAPDGLEMCVKGLGLCAQDCVFVGDSRVDIMAGKKAGVRTIAVHSGVADRELLVQQQPDRILADLSSLISCIGGL